MAQPLAERPAWGYLERLTGRLGDSPGTAAFRAALIEGDADLERRFLAGEPVEELVRDRARLVDALLREGWQRQQVDPDGRLALLAVGGYGRGELHPCSDIDLTVLLPDGETERWHEALERFLTFLWDIGLEVGHSVRTVNQCQTEAVADLTVVTTLMEARLLGGSVQLAEAMRRALAPSEIWPADEFFEAKRREQITRHHRYHDTAYNLEPNVKGSPGGLRDIQVIGWVAKRHFGAETLHELVDHGFLTEIEYRKLVQGQSFLWRVRFALHTLTGRREDRLLFDHQIRVAKLFGYEDATYTLAVEQFMQKYYRTVMGLSRLNEMLLQLFQEAMFETDAEPTPIDGRFQVRNGYLEVTRDDVFNRQPPALLELFHILQQHPDLRGVSAGTIRLVRRNLLLIDDEFRQNPRNHRLFLDILRAPIGVTHELRRMNLYGVLGRYIPAFGRIVGRMQYDLFHAYTVDAHTLFVVSNLRRFSLSRYNHEFPYCSEIVQSLPKRELVYLAGLFHDIAKGRGGDHSELGAVDAESFCLEHGLSRYDARLVAWLVRHHLALSMTAQRKDISDPQVIHEFAEFVGDQMHLDHLYVLTVADVRGTNPKLWNSWKAALFEELYQRTKRALRRGLENPIDKDELIAETQAAARKLLAVEQIDGEPVASVWSQLGDDYFLRHTPAEIAWHTGLLAARRAGEADPEIAVQHMDERGGTVIFICMPVAQQSFAKATAVLDELGLNVLDARITPTNDGYRLHNYVVLENDGSAIAHPGRCSEIAHELRRSLTSPEETMPRVTRRAPRQVRMFSTPTTIAFSDDAEREYTIMELVTGDRPGLLCEVGKSFVAAGVRLATARIVTVGERAEDVFYVTAASGGPLDEASRDALESQLRAALDQN